ncbi:MAG TPA: FecR domain-containing protein [Polyangia bacterium]|nr:FecR domain-containing protein [Polyangia bacterium]
MSRRRDPEAGAAESDELERLCDGLRRLEAPFDEITRSRAETRLGAELERQPAWGTRRGLGRAVALLAVGAAMGAVLASRAVGTAGRPRPAVSGASSLRDEPRFEPYVVAPTTGVGTATVPEALVRPTSRLDVPAGWLVRASLGDAIAITLKGPARAWSEPAAESAAGRRTVIHLERGRLLASLEGGAGRRLQIVSPGAVTDVVGTLFSVEVVGAASRVAVAHGRVQVSATPESPGGAARAPREVTAGQSWLTTLPEPDDIEPALVDALAEHERTPAPRGAAVPLSVAEAPAGTGVWVGKRRIASAPAWVLVESHVAVRLSAPPRSAASEPSSPPTEPAAEPAHQRPRPRSEPRARATPPADWPPPLTEPGADPTEPPAFAASAAVTAQSLFREADAARAAGDTALALRTLRTLIERFPRESATAAARYELALMEGTTGHEDAALRDLAAIDTPSLEEPTEYLRCRVLAKRAASQAERCLADFRRRFPTSAHDADALASETALAMVRGGCPAAQALLTELARLHPEHRSAARLRAACGGRP